MAGNNGIYYLIQAVNKLLDPRTPEFTAAFVGRLCAVVIDRCGALLGDTLDLILCSVLSKMQRVQTISVMQVGGVSIAAVQCLFCDTTVCVLIVREALRQATSVMCGTVYISTAFCRHQERIELVRS